MRRKINSGYWVVLLLVVSFVYSCANKGPGPQGGPKDETPPRVMKSVPENGIVNFQKKEIQVDFDENIALEKVFDNVVISPPQQRSPDIRALGKRLVVRFDENLTHSTTYTINFGNAVVDLNEKNPLKNYRFSFSTGPEIDTLGVSGYVINAENLNPIPGVFVGIYTETSDSVFQHKPFLRIGKTDADGRFSIDNMKNGTYQIFALGDNNRDYFFQPGEGLAMYDSLITTSFVSELHSDTVYSDTTKTVIDTILTHHHTHLLPDDILLRFFYEGKKHQRLVKTERLQPEKFTMYFNAPQENIPEIEPLNFDWGGKYIVERNNTLDTLSYWLTDSLVWKIDTLQMAVNYFKTDSIFQLVPTSDTINAIMRHPNARARNRRAETDRVVPLNLNTNISPAMEIYNSIILRVGEPLSEYNTEKITLNQKVDTLLTPVQYEWRQIDSTKMNFALDFDRKPEMSYELTVDSAAFISVYEKANNRYSSSFKIRPLSYYSEIKVILTNYDSRAIIQILDTKDKVIAAKRAEAEETLFQYIKPADYYIRLFIDENENGVWDTGNLNLHRQPEEVYYYPHKLTLKANFEFTEEWDHKSIPLLEQKPKELQGSKK